MPVTPYTRALRHQPVVSLRRFTGINYIDNPSMIADTELQKGQNIIIKPTGSIITRPSISLRGNLPGGVGSTSTDWKYLGQYIQQGGVNSILALSDGGTKLWKSSDGGANWVIVFTFPSQCISGVQYLDIFYMITVANGMYKLNGLTVFAVATTPNGFDIFTFKDRLWIIGSDSQLFYSNVGPAQETGLTTNVIKISPGDGARLVTAVPLGDHLMIFKQDSIWNLFMAPDPLAWNLRVFDNTRGVLSPYAVKVVDGWVYFMGYSAIWRTDGSVTPVEMTKAFRNIFYVRPQLNPTVFYSADYITHFDRYLFCLVQNASAAARYFVYSIETGTWTEWTFTHAAPYQPTEVWEFIQQGGGGIGQVVRLMSHNLTNNQLGIMNDPNVVASHTDFNIPIPVDIMTKKFDFSAPWDNKRMKVLMAEFGGLGGISLIGSPRIAYSVDQETTQRIGCLAGTIQLNYPSAAFRIRGAGYFREVAVEVTDNTGGHLDLQSLNIWLSLKGEISEEAS